DFGGVGQIVLADDYLLALRFSAGTRMHNHIFGEVREREHHDTYFSELTLRRSLGRHALVVGTGLAVDSYAPADVPQFSFTNYIPGLFLQDAIVLSSWLSL